MYDVCFSVDSSFQLYHLVCFLPCRLFFASIIEEIPWILCPQCWWSCHIIFSSLFLGQFHLSLLPCSVVVVSVRCYSLELFRASLYPFFNLLNSVIIDHIYLSKLKMLSESLEWALGNRCYFFIPKKVLVCCWKVFDYSRMRNDLFE